jgi:CBS domain-containing protein
MKVFEILKLKEKKIFSVKPSINIGEAIKTMAQNDIGSLMVIENGDLVGKLTFREILNFIGKNFNDFTNILVKDLMSSNPITVQDDIGIDEVRKIMIENHIRYLPVKDEKNKLQGVISFHDIAKAALKMADYENKLLKRYIKNWPE